jgi:hypothetical protein
MNDRNTIAQELTAEQLDAFVTELAALPGKERTLRAIAEKAAALGIDVSLMSAKSFRDTTFARHLDRLRRASEKAEQIRTLQETGAGSTLADAAGTMLSEMIYDGLMAENPDEIDIEKYSLAISRMRKGDVELANLRLKLEEAERRERDREAKIRAASEEMEKLRAPKKDFSDEDRQKVVAEVDRILGIKKKGA